MVSKRRKLFAENCWKTWKLDFDRIHQAYIHYDAAITDSTFSQVFKTDGYFFDSSV